MPAIRRWETLNPNTTIEFVQVDVPNLGIFFDWHRISWFLGYLRWLKKAALTAKQLHNIKPFDATFHASVSAYWLPTPTTDLGVPNVWGPVGGAVTSCIRFWPLLGLKGVFNELLDFVAVKIASWYPPTRRTWKNVTIGLINNQETMARLPKFLQARSRVLNHVLFIEPPQIVYRQRKSHILYFSALESRKGPQLAIYALSQTPEDVHLRIAGDGPELHRLERLAQRLKVAHRVKFLLGLSRQQAQEQLTEAAAVVFTGMREEGGASLAEAMLSGAPVIVLANGGARTVAEARIDPDRVVLVQPSSAEETARHMGIAMTRFVRKPNTRDDPNLDQESGRQALRSAFKELLKLHSVQARPTNHVKLVRSA
jgi:hypothetical protein